MVAVGCGIKPWQSYEDLLPKAQTEQKALSEEEEKWRSRMKSYDEKVSKIRSNERKQKQEKTAIDQMCICIIHYFPQYTFNELKKLTYFAILELYE